MSQSNDNQQQSNPVSLPPHFQTPPPEQKWINLRQIWATNRLWMEMSNMKSKRYGNKKRHHWYQLLFAMKTFEFMLRLTGLYKKGVSNAENIVLRDISLYFSNLPKAFDGFTILHLSDLHLEAVLEKPCLNNI